jgi:hypothetical protein
MSLSLIVQLIQLLGPLAKQALPLILELLKQLNQKKVPTPDAPVPAFATGEMMTMEATFRSEASDLGVDETTARELVELAR